MLKEKAQVIFRVVVGLAFISIGVKSLISSDYLLGGISLIGGIAFLASLFIKKNGEKK